MRRQLDQSTIAMHQLVRVATSITVVCLLLASTVSYAQQFTGDNQWVAPYGVATLVGTVGEDYSQFIATATLIPEYEFNVGFTHYSDDPRDNSGSYTATNLYIKKRLRQNDAETAGFALVAGTGLTPEHLENDEVSSAGESWWVNGIATYSFSDDQVLLDVIPGVVLDLDKGQSDENAWGFTYASRLAIYGMIPQTAVVTEVFGTTGEAYAPPSYRFGLRWESPKLILALTYSDAFDSSGGAGLEAGFMYLTEPRLCWHGCSPNR